MNINISISSESVAERIQFENPWWVSGIRSFEDVNWTRNKIDLWTANIDYNLLVTGPKKTGKTQCIRQHISHWIKSDFPSTKILYLQMCNPIYSIYNMIELICFAKEKSASEELEGWKIIIDDIHYVQDWENEIDLLCKFFANDHLIFIGSMRSSKGFENCAHKEFPIVRFSEFLDQEGIGHLLLKTGIQMGQNIFDGYQSRYTDTLNDKLISYINRGGFATDQVDIYDFLHTDLPSLNGIYQTDSLYKTFCTIAYHSGQTFSYEILSKRLGLSKITLKKHIDYLEKAYLIKVHSCVSVNAQRYKRVHNFKIYLINPSIRTLIYGPVHYRDAMISSMIETALATQWTDDKAFSRDFVKGIANNIDFISLDKELYPRWVMHNDWAEELTTKQKMLTIYKFCVQHRLQMPIVTTMSKHGIVEMNELNIQLIPASFMVYSLGKRTL